MTDLLRAAKRKLTTLRTKRTKVARTESRLSGLPGFSIASARMQREFDALDREIAEVASQVRHLQVALWQPEARDLAHQLNDELEAAERAAEDAAQ